MVEAGIPKKSSSNAMILYERFRLNQSAIEILCPGLLSLVLNIRKVARGYIHSVANVFAALTLACPRCFYGLSESLEVIKWYWSFCHFCSPSYIV